MSEIKIGLIGGSGLGQVLGEQSQGMRHEVQTPFGPPSDAIIETNWGGLPVFLLPRHGPGHLLSPTQVPFRANIFAMKQLGVTHIIASGAVGSLREEFRPRDLVIPDQIIDKTTSRPATFFQKATVHVEFAEPFCNVLRNLLIDAAASKGSEKPAMNQSRGSNSTSEMENPAATTAEFTVHGRGCYVCMEGPAFSTRAESLMHRLWGGDLIGMTAMPEAKLAREAEISYALLALVTDYDCWRKNPPAQGTVQAPHDAMDLLKEIIANLKAASDNGLTLIRRAVEQIAANPAAMKNCPAAKALKLAIWSDKARIPRSEVELLAPLWMKYFEQVS